MFRKNPLLGFALGVALAIASASLKAAEAPAGPPAAAGKTSITDFFRTPDVQGVRLSPDGNQLLAIIRNGSDHVGLAVFNIKNLKESKVIVASDELHVDRAYWVNPQRIVFTVRKPPGKEDIGPGLWAVNNDGSDLRQLIDHSRRAIEAGTSIKNRSLPWAWGLFAVLDDGSDDVIVEQFTFDTKRQLSRTNLARLNTRTHERTTLGTGAPMGSKDWVLDRQGEPMWATTLIQGQLAMYVKKTASQPWEAWATSPVVPGPETDPVWVGPNREVYVLKRQSEQQTTALYRLDAQTWKPEPQPLVSIKGYDLSPEFVYDATAKRLLGLHFTADAHSSVWFDPAMKAAQAEVDKLLGATVNLLHCKRCLSNSNILVEAFSDRMPSSYYLV